MIKHLFAPFVLACSTFFACGGVEDFEPLDDGSAGEFGEVEQQLSAGKTQNYGAGINTSTQRLNCNNTSLTQQCRVPGGGTLTTKTVGYCFSNSFTPGQITALNAGISGIDTSTNWTFTQTTFPCVLNFENAVLGSSGSSSLNLDDYGKFDPTGTLTDLTESVPGSYKSFDKGICRVNIDDVILAEAARPSGQLFRHIGGACAAAFTGVGIRTDHAGRPTSRSVTIFNNGLTAGEMCRASSVSLSSPGTLSVGSCQTSD